MVLKLELIEIMKAQKLIGVLEDVEAEDAIQGFGGATLVSAQPHKTADVLEHVLGFACLGHEAGFLRFKSDAPFVNIIDIKLTPSVGG